MTFLSCVLYILANLTAMLLFWAYRKHPTQNPDEHHRSKKSNHDSSRHNHAHAHKHKNNNHHSNNNQQSNNNSHNSKTNHSSSRRGRDDLDGSVLSTSTFKRQSRKEGSNSSLLSLLGLSYNKTFFAFEDKFVNFDDVAKACRRAGLEKCGLIVGVDFSASNEWQGRKTFSGQNMHQVLPGKSDNPYQKVISIIGRTLEPFDEDNLIPAYGFGDSVTAGKCVFSFTDEDVLDWREDKVVSDVPCRGFSEVLDKYCELASKVVLGGPTDFAPIIYKAVEIVKQLRKYHILIVIADGQVTEESSTMKAIVEASMYPLSIVMIGVGDGPWDTMETFDDCLPERAFDNFQFVNFHDIMSRYRKNPDARFALHAMMEIPDQYKTIKNLGYLNDHRSKKHHEKDGHGVKKGRVASSMIGAIGWLRHHSVKRNKDE